MDITVKLEVSPPVLRDVYKLRAFVWRQLSADTRFLSEEWNDEFDARASHWVVFVDGALAAAARMTVHENFEELPDFEIFSGVSLPLQPPIASINRLVVHPAYRGMGLSRRLDACRLDAAKKLKVRNVVVVASELSGLSRLRSLEKLGFIAVAPLYSRRNWDWVTPMVLQISTGLREK